MPVYRICDLFDLNQSIAEPLFLEKKYPHEVLSGISNFILQLGPLLPKTNYQQIDETVWVAKTANIAKTAFICGPCIIDEFAEIRHGAFIRGSAIVGKNAVVGNSTELKNSILFNKAQVPHFNYVGDSVLGHCAHFGAGVITSNVKSNKSPVSIKCEDELIETGRKKAGTFAGDFAEVGCNSVLCPGCILGKKTIVYPTSHVRRQLPHGHIFKAENNIIKILNT